MVLCFVALIVFSILGVFSARHRVLAKEAFDCVFRKVTLRKCQTGLDRRIRASITSKFFKLHPKIGSFTYKHFEALSWAFTILTVWSVIAVGVGGYNYWMYGNCNGPNSDGFCVFDPTGKNSAHSTVEEGCTTPELLQASLTLEGVNTSLFFNYSNGEKNEVIIIGCFSCPYTREAYPTLKKLVSRDDVGWYFAHFQVKNHSALISPVLNCVYERDKQSSINLIDRLFTIPVDDLMNDETIISLLDEDIRDEIISCANSKNTQDLVDKQRQEVIKTGVYGTPLVWVNNEPLVGPKPLRVYKRLLS